MPRAAASLAVTVAAVKLACVGFVHAYPTVIYDSWGYYFLSESIRKTGLLPWPADFRTYGYPLFLAALSGFRGLPPEELRLAAFGVQLAAYLAACAFVARRLAKILGSPAAGLAAYAVAALNPALLVHAAETLSDLLSAILIQLAVALAWRTPGSDDESGAAGRRHSSASLRAPFLSFLCAGLATAVRPANAVVVAALGLVWIVRVLRWRERAGATAIAAFLGVVPPLLPQVVINYDLAHRITPLLVRSLYKEQRSWGMGTLKYGTVVIPGHSPFLAYTNPFYRGDPGPRAFLRNHPVQYLATLGLHGFGLVDQDLPYTYITDLATPWYRWPLSILEYGLYFLALVGGAQAVIRVVRHRIRELDALDFALLSSATVGGAYAVIYLPVEVESRFGLPLLLLMTPFVIVGARWILGVRSARPGAYVLALAAGCVFLLGCAGLSAWMSTRRVNAFVASPANAFVLDPPRAFTTRGQPTPHP